MEGPDHDLPIRLAANELLLRACRRHNTVHPKILHHLAVVVIPMCSGKSGDRGPRAESVNRLNGYERIIRRNGRDGLVRIDERSFQCSHRFIFSRNCPDRLHVAVRFNAAPAEKK